MCYPEQNHHGIIFRQPYFQNTFTLLLSLLKPVPFLNCSTSACSYLTTFERLFPFLPSHAILRAKILHFSEIRKKICKIIVPQNKNSQISHISHANFCIALFALSALSPSIVQIVQKVQSKFLHGSFVRSVSFNKNLHGTFGTIGTISPSN